MVTVFAEITLLRHDETDFEAFEQFVQAIDEVCEYYLMASGFDYLLRIDAATLVDCQEAIERLQTGAVCQSVSSLAVLRQRRRQ